MKLFETIEKIFFYVLVVKKTVLGKRGKLKNKRINDILEIT